MISISNSVAKALINISNFIAEALIGLGARCCNINNSVLSVSTPICFGDGCAVNLYVEILGTTATVTDDGNTLMRFHSMGAGDSSSLESSLSRIARNHGGELINGRFVFKAQSITKAYANCCDAMRQVVNQEKEILI